MDSGRGDGCMTACLTNNHVYFTAVFFEIVFDIVKIKLFRSIIFCSKFNFLSNKQKIFEFWPLSFSSFYHRWRHNLTYFALYLLNNWFSDISCDMFLNQFLMLFRMVQKFFHFSAKNIFFTAGTKNCWRQQNSHFYGCLPQIFFPYTTRGMCAKFQSCFTKCTIVMFFDAKRLNYDVICRD